MSSITEKNINWTGVKWSLGYIFLAFILPAIIYFSFNLPNFLLIEIELTYFFYFFISISPLINLYVKRVGEFNIKNKKVNYIILFLLVSLGVVMHAFGCTRLGTSQMCEDYRWIFVLGFAFIATAYCLYIFLKNPKA